MTTLIWTPPAGAPGSPVELDSASDAQIKLRGLPSIADAVAAQPYTTKAPGQQGDTALDVAIPARVVTARAVLQAADHDALWDLRADIARAFAQQPVRFGESLVLGLLTLQRAGYADREIDAAARSVDTQRLAAAGMGTLDAEWYCPYPWWRDTADSTLTLDDFLIDAAGVTITDASGNMIYVGTDPGPAANAGDVDAPMVAKIYGPFTSFTLTNASTGEAFTITLTMVAGNYVTVDTTPGQKSITKTVSGVETSAWANLSLTSPRLFGLRPGNTTVRIITAGADANTHVVITWRNRYGGVK